MKKLKWSILGIACLFLVTGCGTTPEETLKKATNNMSALDTCHMKVKANISMKSEGVEFELPINLDMDVDNVTKISKMDVAFSLMGMNIKTTGYIDASNELETITYTQDVSDLSVWTKEVSKTNSFSISDLKFDQIAESIKEIKSEDKNSKTFEVNIPKEKIKELISKSQYDTSDFNLDEIEMKDNIIINITVDKKTNYISRIYLDLLKSISFSNQDVEITKLDIELLITEFNTNETIKIDQSIIDSANKSIEDSYEEK